MRIKKILAVLLLSAAIAAPVKLVYPASGANSQQLTAFADDYEDFEYDYDYDYDYDGYNDQEDDAPSRRSDEEEKKKFSPVRAFIISFVLALIIAFIAVGSMKAKLKTVHRKYEASDYKKENSMVLEERSDSFLYKRVNKTQRTSGK